MPKHIPVEMELKEFAALQVYDVSSADSLYLYREFSFFYINKFCLYALYSDSKCRVNISGLKG
ncbi:hypothetical protein, partial [Paenibacillus nuruki]|uniref:hypothetical protein n=1 Tax=Paenibacillus nuruki TaxID=1886670 RepID=UPI001C30CBDC